MTTERYVTDREAAALLSISPKHMRTMRVRGGGPPFSKLGPKMVRYRVDELMTWAASRSVSSTSQTPGAAEAA